MQPEKLVASFAENFVSADVEVNETFQNVLFNIKDARSFLCLNEHLVESVWFKLFKRPSLKVEDAKNLCDRELTSEQISLVLKKEKRSSVLNVMLDKNVLTEVELEKVIMHPVFNASVGSRVEKQLSVSSSLRRELALKSGGLTALKWLSDGVDIDAKSAESLLKLHPEWVDTKSFKQRSLYLNAILERFPSLINFYASSQNEAFLSTAAGSRLLTDVKLQEALSGVNSLMTSKEFNDKFYTYVAFINNPVVQESVLLKLQNLEAFKALDALSSNVTKRLTNFLSADKGYSLVEDKEVLSWLTRRVLPNDYKPAGRPHDAAELVLNPHLNEIIREEIAGFLSYPSSIETLADKNVKLWDDILVSYPNLLQFKPVSFTKYVSTQEDSDSYFDELPFDEYDLNVILETQFLSCFDYYGQFKTHFSYALGEVLGTNAEAWDNLLAIGPDFKGTVKDLLEIVVNV